MLSCCQVDHAFTISEDSAQIVSILKSANGHTHTGRFQLFSSLRLARAANTPGGENV